MIRNGATIGANATIICGIEIGAYSFIGAGAVVTKSVNAYALIMGNPAVQKGWMSKYGHPLKFDRPPVNSILSHRCDVSGEEFRAIHYKKIHLISEKR